MDHIFLEGLECDAIIGVYDWEREVRQTLFIDLQLGWDIRPAAADDALSLALDYDALSKRLRAYVADSEFQLIETLAESLAQLIHDEFHVDDLVLRIHKPGAVAKTRTLGVQIERHFGESQ